MSDLTFRYPWLLLLAVLPLVLRWLLPTYRQPRGGVEVPFLDRLARLSGAIPEAGAVVARPTHVQSIVQWVAWLAIVVSMARPQRLEKPIVKNVPTRDMLLAVDLSGSMETQDFTDATGKRVDRLTAVKQVLDDFLSRRKGDRVGLIFFGSAAFVQAPFTEDLDACRSLLDEAQVRMAGPKTAFGDAIGLALTVFEHEKDVNDRVLIALTDGNDTGSQVPPDRAAEIARDRKITIHTVAVGDPAAAGEEKLDEATLKAVANTTGGRYSRANDRAALAEIYARLDALEPRTTDAISHRPQTDLYYWPLAVAFLVGLLYHGVRALQVVFRASRPQAANKVAPAVAAAVAPWIASLAEFHFLRPWWLIALVPALLLYRAIGRHQDSSRAWRNVIEEHLLAHLMQHEERKGRVQPRHLLLAGWLLTALALAGPTWQREPSPFSDDESALVIVMEVTPTMMARDIQPSRLERAALKIRDLLALRPGTKTALVAYAGSAHVVMPLTRDAELVGRFAEELSPAIMPREGNDVGDALALANEQLKRSDLRGSILLIVDSLSEEERGQLAAQYSAGIAPVQVLAVAGGLDQPLPADSPPAPALDQQQLQAAADALHASLTVVTPDSADVNWLAAHTVTSFVSAAGAEAGDRWRDVGYWLVFGVAALGLFWFRPGWVVSWE